MVLSTHSRGLPINLVQLDRLYDLLVKLRPKSLIQMKLRRVPVEFLSQIFYCHPALFYKVGDQVCLYSPIVKKGNCRKVNSKWTGPVSVNEVLSDIVIRIRLKGGTKNKVVHLNPLKPYLQ